ncbi:hypothetical protein [Enterocloster clostridioformis]|uniref:hypothetical protein n=1 Tax=Enterocloster clostridioformis TaxID=1531 RepID=UPI001570CDB4|nr:hypothetical protein [Enterocloster clostridioformis]NSJ57132.1 hypothetical protein [Enterocloster clostridioformis]
MKLVLKIFALPVLLILAIICLLAKLAQTVSGYAFTLFLFLIVACGIASIVQSNWLSLGILAGMGLAAFLTLFIIVAACFTLEEWRDGLSDFIRS